eukprot:PITA_12652
MSCGKWTCLVAVSELLCLLAVIAQPGFLSIDCGGQTNYSAENNIQWVIDVNYIDVGYGSPSEITWDFKSHQPSLSLSIETLGMLVVETIPITNLKIITPLNYEKVLVSSGSVLYICLIRTSEDNDPFISAVELRTLLRGMYRQSIPGTMLSLESRYVVSANSLIRYPQDEFDRLCSAMPAGENTTLVRLQKLISTNNTQDVSPPIVMQTALVSGGETLYKYFSRTTNATKSLLLLYFVEIEPLNIT